MTPRISIPILAFTAACFFVPLLQAQPQVIEQASVKITETSDLPQAVVTAVHGKCEYAVDGPTFQTLKVGQIVVQGSVVRTGNDSRADLFFRRIGTTVRLQPNSEIKLEHMTRTTIQGVSKMHTLLEVKAGRIFTVVRSVVPGSTFEIRNAAGLSVIEAGGSGRYIVTADGSQVSDRESLLTASAPGTKGVTMIAPGQTFKAKEGKPFAEATPEAVQTLIQFDELEVIGDRGTRPPVKVKESGTK